MDDRDALLVEQENAARFPHLDGADKTLIEIIEGDDGKQQSLNRAVGNDGCGAFRLAYQLFHNFLPDLSLSLPFG